MDAPYLSTFPTWLPGESFFSLCSRLHFLSSNLQPAVTSRELFALSERSIKHDLPCGLDTFEKSTAGRWGDALVILENRTIFPFFSPFQSRSMIEAAISCLRSSTVGSLKYQLGLVCGGFGADHPLKACLCCMRRDIEEFGVSYWHLEHQYPGVLICSNHREALSECTRNHRWSGRFSWTLPAPSILREMGYGTLHPEELARLSQIAKACCDLSSLGFDHHFEPLDVAKAYRKWLPNEAAAESFHAHLEPLHRFHPFTNTPRNLGAAHRFIGQMVRAPRRSFHPLKHLLMITWLFDDIESFVRCYAENLAQAPSPVSPQVSLQEPESCVPAQRGAPRPKRLKPDVRKCLLAKLAEGASKHQICEEFQVTISTVNKLLRLERGVQASWLAQQAADNLAIHRGAWINLRQSFPLLPINELRRKHPALYAWLHRNDRAWLDAQAVQMPKPVRCYRHVDWDKRDDCLLRQVKDEILRHYGTDRDLWLRQAQIFTLIPRLAQRLERRDHYPRTRAYIKQVTIG